MNWSLAHFGRRRIAAHRQACAGRGQSVVEFALALPVFLGLLFGSLELGMIYKTHAAYQEAAQEAVRVATTVGNPTDQPALDELKRTLSAENLNNISAVTVYDATASGDFAVPPTSSDNAHTDYVYSPAAGTFVCKVSLGAPPCTGQSYWPPSARNGTMGALDHVGIKITYTYKSVTGAFAALQLTETASAQLEPSSYAP